MTVRRQQQHSVCGALHAALLEDLTRRNWLRTASVSKQLAFWAPRLDTWLDEPLYILRTCISMNCMTERLSTRDSKEGETQPGHCSLASPAIHTSPLCRQQLRRVQGGKKSCGLKQLSCWLAQVFQTSPTVYFGRSKMVTFVVLVAFIPVLANCLNRAPNRIVAALLQ